MPDFLKKNRVQNVTMGEKKNKHCLFSQLFLFLKCEIVYFLHNLSFYAAYLDAESLRNNNLLKSSSDGE